MIKNGMPSGSLPWSRYPMDTQCPVICESIRPNEFDNCCLLWSSPILVYCSVYRRSQSNMARDGVDETITYFISKPPAMRVYVSKEEPP
jgi:hypothetical protein